MQRQQLPFYIENRKKKKKTVQLLILKIGGTSLVVQCLRFRTPNTGAPVPSLVRELDECTLL